MPTLINNKIENPENIKTAVVDHPQAVMEVTRPFRKRDILAAFMLRPKGIRFETQEEDEEILVLLRAHLITNAGWVLLTIILLILPFFLMPFFLQKTVIPVDFPPGYFLILPLLWYLGTIGYAFLSFLKWYYNVYVVTNLRIVDIDWISLMYKQLSSALLQRIQDVTYKQGGLVDSFFDFGDVYIQTAGEEPNFEFEAVPNPNNVVREINKIIEIHSPKTDL